MDGVVENSAEAGQEYRLRLACSGIAESLDADLHYEGVLRLLKRAERPIIPPPQLSLFSHHMLKHRR